MLRSAQVSCRDPMTGFPALGGGLATCSLRVRCRQAMLNPFFVHTVNPFQRYAVGGAVGDQWKFLCRANRLHTAQCRRAMACRSSHSLHGSWLRFSGPSPNLSDPGSARDHSASANADMVPRRTYLIPVRLGITPHPPTRMRSGGPPGTRTQYPQLKHVC